MHDTSCESARLESTLVVPPFAIFVPMVFDIVPNFPDPKLYLAKFCIPPQPLGGQRDLARELRGNTPSPILFVFLGHMVGWDQPDGRMRNTWGIFGARVSTSSDHVLMP